MKRLVFCIVAALALSFSSQQAEAQRYYEGDYVLELNGYRMTAGGSWITYLPTKYNPIYITVKAYKFTNGQLVEVPWDIVPYYAPELYKTKSGNTLTIKYKENPGRNWGCAVAIDIDGGGGIDFQFWVNLPPDSY